MRDRTKKLPTGWIWAAAGTLALALLLPGANAIAAEKVESCLKPAGGPVAQQAPAQAQAAPLAAAPAVPLARVSQPAPDFEANAFHQGKFKTLKLSDFKGKWVVLCFYPGDFTFV